VDAAKAAVGRWVARRMDWFLAYFRLHLATVCKVNSEGRGDYHDYPDDEHGSFMCHMVTLKCQRCGHEFTV
jgi:hypothetical protein